MAISDVEKMVLVGLIWGSTNALMRKGALIWDNKSKLLQSSSSSSTNSNSILLAVRSFLHLVLTWQYSLPLAVNLSASAAFFAVLAGDAPISLAVPVTNATTFTATAVAGVFLGEEIRFRRALLGYTLSCLAIQEQTRIDLQVEERVVERLKKFANEEARLIDITWLCSVITILTSLCAKIM